MADHNPKSTTLKEFLSLQDASKESPYSQEYLSLLARRGKIFAKKIGRNWYTTRPALQEYIRQQSITISLPQLTATPLREAAFLKQKKFGKPILVSAPYPLTPEEPDEETISPASPTGHEGHSKIYEEFERLNTQTPTVVKNSPPPRLLNQPNQPTPIRPAVSQPVSPSVPGPEPIKPDFSFLRNSLVQKPEDQVLQKLDKLSDSLNTFAARVTDKISEPMGSLLSPDEKEFLAIESQSVHYKFARWNAKGKDLLHRQPSMTAIVVSAIVVIFILVGGFSFGRADEIIAQVRKAFTNADTIQGHFPGTHADEVLVLDKAGNVSIFGHIETQGQLRSHAPTGVAPIVIDSITKVENLNADYFDNLDSKDFTLAFVTQNGNITYDDVLLEGNVEVGKTLTVKGAFKLMDSLTVYGKLGVFSEAIFGKDVQLTNGSLNIHKGNLRLDQGTIEINDRTLVRNLNSEFFQGKVPTDFTLNYVVANGNETNNVAFFNAGLYGGDGTFKTLGVAGDTILGNPAKKDKITIAIFSKQFSVDESGNLSVGGNATTTGLIVNGDVRSDLTPPSSGSYDLGAIGKPWDNLYANNIFADTASIANFTIDTLKAGDGTVTSPSITFVNDTNTGFYRIGSDSLGVTAGGTRRFSISSTGVSSSVNFEVIGFSSASQTFGSGLSDCSLLTSKLTWNVTTGKFSCGSAAIGVQEGNTAITSNAATISFDAGGFNVTASGGTEAIVKIDYVNGPASRALNEIITGFWRFTNSASVTPNFEVYGGYASLSNALFANDGFVGIANRSPNQRLDVTGNILASTSGNVDFILRSSTTTGPADNDDSKFTLRSGSTSERFDIINGSGTKLVMVSSKGNIAIGSDSFDARLTLRGVSGGSAVIRSRANANEWAGIFIGDNGANSNGLKVQAGNGSATVAGFLVKNHADTSTYFSVMGNGNVGIGIIFPEQKLEVNGNIHASSSGNVDVMLRSSSAVSDEGLFRLRSAGSFDRLDILNQSSVLVSVASLGNVGIGTTIPLTRLEVQGTASASNLLTVGSLQVANGGSTVSYSRFGTNATNYSTLISAADDLLISGDLEIDGQTFFDNGVSVSQNLEVTGYASFSNAFFSQNGNVGIRTRNLSVPLEVNGDASISNTLYAQNLGNVGIGTTGPTALLHIHQTVQDATPALRIIDRSTLGTDIGFHYENFGGTGDVVITNEGNVGIGDITPEQKLTVAGNILASTSGNVDLTLLSTTEDDAKFTLRTSATAGSVARLDILGSASQAFLSIASSGNVGIGTTGPAVLLDILSAGSGRTIRAQSNDATIFSTTTFWNANFAGAHLVNTNTTTNTVAGLMFATNNNNAIGAIGTVYTGENANSAALVFATSNGAGSVPEKMRITADGNVGIGTSSPTTKLDVSGNASVSGNFEIGTNLYRFTSTGASWSLPLEITAYSSAAQRFGSGLTDCDNSVTSKLLWSDTGLFSCGLDQNSGIKTEESGALILATSSIINFDGGKFSLTASGTTETIVNLDWGDGGPASLSQNEIVTGFWRFTNSASITPNFEVYGGYASLSNALFVNNGNVGIRTRNLSVPLEVNGDASISNTFYAVNAGNVGIGTTTPTAKLDVVGAASISSNFGVNTNKFYVNATTGNVGIGTKTPLTRLEVQGTASASNLLTVGGLQVAGGTSVSYSRFGTNATTHSLNGNDDVLISNRLEVDGLTFLDGNVVIAAGASNSGDLEVTGVIKASDGSATAPSYTFKLDTNTGFYRIGDDTIGATTGGAERMRITLQGASVSSTFETTTAKASTYSGDGAVTVQSGGGNTLSLDTGGAGALNIGLTNASSVTIARTGIVTVFNDDIRLTGNDIQDSGANPRITVGATTSITGNAFVSGAASVSGNFQVGTATLYASTTNNRVGVGTKAPLTRLEVKGTASASHLLTSGGLQVANTSSVAYSRFGTNATNRGLAATHDVLVSGMFEVDSFAFFDSAASVATNFEASGYVSTSQLFGSVAANCSNGITEKVLYNSSTGKFTCGVDQTVGGSGGGFMEVREYPGGFDSTVATISFEAGHFQLTASGTRDVVLRLDWGAGGPASLSESETVTGLWTFSKATSFSSNIEVAGVIESADGTITAPGIAFNSDMRTGIFKPGASILALTATGSEKFRVSASGASVSANFEIGTNKFYVDQDNGRVGVNTQNLTDALEVFGNASLSNVFYATNAGNVGIGTTSPGTKLDVVGNASISAILEATTLKAATHTGDGAVSVLSGGANTLTIDTGGAAALNIGGTNASSLTLARTGVVTVFNDDIRVVGNDIQDSTSTARMTFGSGFTDFNDDIEVSGADIRDSGGTNRLTFTTTGASGLLSVTGFASISQDLETAGRVISNGVLQAGGTTPAAYSRFGTAATSHGLSAASDVLVSGIFETDSTVFMDGQVNLTANASVSGNLEILSFASASSTYGSGLTNCSGLDKALQWASSNGRFQCQTVSAGGIGAVTLSPSVADTDGDADPSIWINDTGGGRFLRFQNAGIEKVYVSIGGDIISSGAFNFAKGSAASVSYSRLGPSATTHSNFISTAGDLLISNDFEVDGSAQFDSFLQVGAGATPAFFVNPTTGNVGIGTTAPAAKLDVNGAVSVSGNFEVTGNNRLGINAGGATDTTLEVGGTASISGATTLGSTLGVVSAITQSGANASNSFAGSLNTTLGIHTATNLSALGQLFVTGVSSNSFSGSLNTTLGIHSLTNVSAGGIFLSTGGGSNSFGGSLNTTLGVHSATDVSAGNRLMVSRAGNADLFLSSTGEDDAQFSIRASGTSGSLARLDILGSASQKFVSIASSGNVGINTTAPKARLEVQGTASASSTYGSGLSDCTSVTNALRWDVATGKFSCGTVVGSSGSTVAVRESNGAFSNRSSLSFEAAHFAVSFPVATEALVKLDWGSGGPASLSQSESVTGTWTFSAGATISPAIEIAGYASASRFFAQDGSAVFPSYAFANDQNTGLFRGGNDILGFATGGLERIRIAADGNVGVVDDSPEQKFSVEGNILASTSGNIDIILHSSTEDDAKFTIRDSATAGSVARLDFLGSASQTFMSIASSGNVGIGTTVPLAQLQIEQTTGVVGRPLLLVNNNATGQTNYDLVKIKGGLDNGTVTLLRVEQGDPSGGTGGGYLIRAFGDSEFDTSSSDLNEVFSVRSGVNGASRPVLYFYGNVGIGTQAPTALFEVRPSVGGNIPLVNVASSSGTSFFHITKAGNVGIGTTSPAAALDVRPQASYTGPLLTVASGSNERFKVYSNGNASASAILEAVTLKATTHTGDAAVTVLSGGANTLRIDAGGTAVINIGDVNASAIGISRAGITTTFNGPITGNGGNLSITGNASASGNFEATGNVIANGVIQGGGTNTAAYNRFGTSTTTHSLSSSADLLVSGILEVDGTVFVDGTGSHSAAGEWNFDSSTFVVDSGTNRVGIGTDSPLARLEVNGTASASSFTTVGVIQAGNGGATASYSRFGTGTPGSALISANNDVFIAGDLEVSGTIIDGPLIASSASISGNFEVTGYASASLFYAGSGTAASPSFSFGQDRDTGIYRPSVNQMALSTFGTERLRIDNTGNIGIGTTTPQSLLDISNASESAVTLSRNDTAVTADELYGRIDFWTNDSNLTNEGFNVGARIEARAANAITTNDAPAGYLTFFTTPNAASASPLERMRIDSTGNVAIGTITPASLFDVSNSSESAITLSRNDSTVTADELIGRIDFWNNDTQLNNDGLNQFARIETRAANDITASDSASGYLAFFTAPGTASSSPIERLRITNSGNVGIGTTNPLVKFYVSGSGSISANFEVLGYSSSSATFGSGLTDCLLGSNALRWAVATGKFSCGTVTGGGTGSLEVKEGTTTVVNPAASMSFEPGNFNITSSGSFEAVVKLDWPNGPASRAAAQSITGFWQFSGGASIVGTNFEVTGNNRLGVNAGGTTNTTLEVGGIASASTYYAADGDNSAPAYTFSQDTDTGFYRIGTNNLGLTAGGTLRFNVADTGASSAVTFEATTIKSTAYTGDGAVTLLSGGANTLRIDAGGAGVINIGDVNATAVNIARTGVTTTFNGAIQGANAAILTVNGNLNVGGHVQAGDELIVTNAGQFGGTATVAYSRFGTNATGHSLSAASDVLISGIFEADSQVFFDSNVSISGNFEVGSSVLFANSTSGNVGVGTTTPTAKLHIVGTSGTGLMISHTDPSVRASLSMDPGANFTLGMTNGGAGKTILLHTAGSSYLNGGNVGIGTTTPVETFHISGGSGTGLLISHTDPSVFASISIDSGANFSFGMNDGGAARRVLLHTAGSSFLTGGNVGIGDTTPDALFDVEGTASISGNFGIATNKFYVNATGNVGIETKTPTAKLEVKGGTASASLLSISGGSAVAYNRLGTDTTGYATFISTANDLLISGDLEVNGRAFFDGVVSVSGGFEVGGTASASHFYASAGTAASPSFSFRIDRDTGMYNPATNELGFSTLGLERLRIDDTGNVGIGVNDPDLYLTVATTTTSTNNLRLRSARAVIGVGDLVGGIDFASNDTTLTAPGTAVADIRALAEAAHTTTQLSTSLVFRTTNLVAYSEKMRITGAGNVGIWDTSPDAVFEVVASTAGDIVQISSISGGDGDYFTIESTGEVGIGTITPTARLHVIGDVPDTLSTGTGTAANSALTVTGGRGGDTRDNDGTAIGGVGGTMTLTTGAGGIAALATVSNTGGAGGALTLTGGTGGAATGASVSVDRTNVGGAGAAFTFTAGTGGAASGGDTNNGGAGGAITLRAGTGGVGTFVGANGTGGAGGLLTLSGGTSAAASGSAGGAVTITGAAGTATGTGGAGGTLTLTAGAAGGDNTANRAGGAVNITAGLSKGTTVGAQVTIIAGAAGQNLATGTAAGAAGGLMTLTLGAGGTAPNADVLSTGGAGGAYTITPGAGGTATVAGTGNNTGGAGSLFSWTTGAGGAATGATSGNNLGGASGAITLATGAGGAANTATGNNTGGLGATLTISGGTGGAATTAGVTNTGGGGAAFSWIAGTGGAATGATTNNGGAGGAVTLRAGTGGAGTFFGVAGDGGDGGLLTLSGGLSTTSSGSNGGAVTITGTAGTSTGTGGTGGALTLTAGAAGGTGYINRVGGAVAITAGASIASASGAAVTVTTGASGTFTSRDDGSTGGIGGALTFTMGAGGTVTASLSSTGGAGGTFTITGGAGGAASFGTIGSLGNNTGGAGSPFTWTAGAGGAAAGITTGNNLGGASGAITLSTGAGGAASNATGNNTGGASGTLGITIGTGGAATTAGVNNTGGAGGAFTLTAGAGGAASAGTSTNVGGVGGAFTLSAGTGGAGTGAAVGATGGAGGLLTLRGGASAAASGSAGGGVTINGRAGSVTGTGGIGGTMTITAGAGGASAKIGRVGGSLLLTSGAGGALASTSAATHTGAGGGPVTLTIGAGGAVTAGTGAETGGAGGAYTITPGAGGAATSATATSNTGGAGSLFSWTTGAGGAATGVTTGNNLGGASGAVTLATGTGGASSNAAGTNTGGAAGTLALVGGTGGATTTAGTTNTGGAGAIITITSGAGGTATGATTNVGGAGGALTVQAGDGGAGTGAAGGTGGTLTLRGGLGGNTADDGGGGHIIFETASTITRTEAMRITSGSFVGIGTTLPTSLLDISNASESALTLSRNDTTAAADDLLGRVDFWSNDTNLTTYPVTARIEAHAAAGGITADAGNSYLSFLTAGTATGIAPQERMRITQFGNIGIGTTTPLTRLEVDGGASASRFITVGVVQAANGGATVSYSRFGTNTTNYSTFLSAADDVLISGDLEVDGKAFFDGGVSVSGVFEAGGIASAGFFYANSGTAASPSFAFKTDKDTGMFNPTTNQLALATLGAERLRIDANGNVGIGTTIPVGLLALQQPNNTSHVVLANRFSDNNTASGSFLKFRNVANQQVAMLDVKGGFTSYIASISPTIVGSVQDNNRLKRPTAVAVSGRFAYIAASASRDGFSIVDVSNPTAPVIIASLSEPTRLASASAVAVAGRYAYVTAKRTSYFSIIDVSRVNTPIVAGALVDTIQIASPSDVVLSGRYAYVTSEKKSRLSIIDTANPSNPLIVGSIAHTTQLASASAVAVAGRYAYVTAFVGNRLTVVDIQNPSKPYIVGSLNDGTNLNGPKGIYISGRYAYITAATGTRLTVVDISNPASPTVVGSVTDTLRLASATSVVVSGRYAYVTSATTGSGRLTIVDVFTPASPTVVGTVSSTQLNTNEGLYVSGHYAYTTARADNRLVILDLTGFDIPSLNAGDIAAGHLQVWDSADVGGNFSIGGGLNVGSLGLKTDGRLTILVASSSNDNSASPSLDPLLKIVHDKSYLAGDAIFVNVAASTSADRFTGNYLRFQTAGTSRFIIESSGALVASGAAQFGWVPGVATVSYNRFGILTTTHSNYISSKSDVFISGDLEGRGSLSFAGPASLSNALWVSPGGSSGNVGIGTTVPAAKLAISSAIAPHLTSDYTGAAAAGNKGALFFTHLRNSDSTRENLGYIQGVAEDNQSAGGIRFVARNNADVEVIQILSTGAASISSTLYTSGTAGNVGIGTTTPIGLLEVNGNLTGSTNPLFLVASGSTQRLRVEEGGNVGIGLSSNSANFKLDVASGGSRTARFGTASTDTVVIGGGTGKITVGAFDPVYTIEGTRYATYGLSMIGMKEEATGNVRVDVPVSGVFKHEIDVDTLTAGSDLWLFSKVTTLKQHWDDLSVLLTPAGGNARVWYSINKPENKIIIYSSQPTTVSYRFSAPRFDTDHWTNYATDDVDGYILPPEGNTASNSGADPEIVIESSTTGIVDVLAQIANAVEVVAKKIRVTGDIIAQGIRTTYFSVSELFPNVDVPAMVANWSSRSIAIDSLASSSDAGLFRGSGAQAAADSKIDLAENGEYLATYGVDSTRGEIQISGTSNLEYGQAKVFFDYSFTSVISDTVPLKILMTPTTAGITGQIYVATKTIYGFEVKELNGSSNGKFDWLVIARRKGYDTDYIASPELSPTPSASLELTPTPETTVSPSPSPEVAPTPSPSVTPTLSPSPSPESTPSPSPLPTVSESPIPSPTTTPSIEPSPSPTPELIPTPDPLPTPTPTP